MQLPWNRKRNPHRDNRVGRVDPDRLSRRSAPQQTTPIDRPDAIRLVRHMTPIELSTAIDWQLEMCQWVDEAAARGLLDHATYYVADEMIRTRLAAELHLIDEEARSATSTERGLLLGNDRANLQRVAVEVAALRARDHELRSEIKSCKAELGKSTTQPQHTADDAPAAVSLPAQYALPAPLPMEDPGAGASQAQSADRDESHPEPDTRGGRQEPTTPDGQEKAA